MGRIKQSLAWWCFGRFATPEALIAEAAKIGYHGVEMCPQEHWQKVRDSGMRIITEGGHQSIAEGFNRRENHDRIEREITEKLALAQKWEIPCLIVFSGNRNGLPDAAGLEATVEGLQRLAKPAEDAGVTLVLELLNSKVDHADYQCDHTSWGAAVCEAVNSPRVKLLYDIYHMQIMEGDVISCIRSNVQQIGHIHTAGVPGRHDLDDTQELYYPAICRAIAATDYEGYVGQEFTPRNGENWAAALRQAYDACNV